MSALVTSELTLALAGLGGLVIAGVLAHGAWQARKAGPKRPVPTPAAPRAEPVLDDGPGAASLPPMPLADLAPGAVDTPVPRRPAVRLDALVDAIVPLTVEAPVAGEHVLAHLPPTRRAGSKPFFIEAQNAGTGEWEAPAPGQRYREFQAGVQLANRTGALNEIEYSEFVQKVQAFAESVGAMGDFPDMLDVVARARELDAFAGDHDAQLALHLRSRGAAWSVGYIQQCAGRHGFVAGVVPGRLVLPSAEDGAPPVLSLTFDSQAAFAEDPSRAAVRDVMLSFDVPQTESAAEPFRAWQRSAQALAADMDADVVDDHGRPLGDAAFAAIGQELERLYAQLEARDLAAGQPATRRLFS